MKQMFSDSPSQQRRMLLEDNCDSTENKSYFRNLSEDELSSFKDELSRQMIQIQFLESELKRIRDEFKAKIKPLRDSIDSIVESIKSGQIESSGTVYNFNNYEESIVESYDPQGNFISSRKMRPEERQTIIKPFSAQS